MVESKVSLFDERKKRMYPKIKDWSSSQDKMRNTPGHELSLGDWFWFNPFAFRFLIIGGNIVGMSVFGLVSVFTFLKGWIFTTCVLFFMLFLCFTQFMKHWKRRLSYRSCKANFYDMFLREYKIEERKVV